MQEEGDDPYQEDYGDRNKTAINRHLKMSRARREHELMLMENKPVVAVTEAVFW